MTTRLNPKIADALDMDMPEETSVEDSALPVVVEPHEIVRVDNEDVPDMSDLEVRLLENQKRMDDLVAKGMGMVSELYKELPTIEPKYRNRHLEIMTMLMGETRTAIEHMNNLQVKRKEVRLKEAAFGKGKTGETKIGTANFYGTREEVLRMIQGAEEAPPESDSE